MKIFDLLNTYTSEAGSWSIEYNDHKIAYSTPAEHYIAPEDDGDELDDIDTKQDIYRLYWFNNTPVGHYCILANSIEELEEKIINVIQDENLTKYHNKEKIIVDDELVIDKLYGALAGLFLVYSISTEKGSGKIICDFLKEVEQKLQYKTQECQRLKEECETLSLENKELYKFVAEFKEERKLKDKYKQKCDRYRNVLEEIEEIVSKDYYGDTWADISIKLDNIRNIINKANGDEND